MTVTVLDSSNLPAILADAGVTLDEPEVKETPNNEVAAEKPADKGSPGDEDPDDIEGDDGLTPRQKRDLTQTMQRAIGKKHRALKEAEEFAAAQYSERRLAEERAARFERELEAAKSARTPEKVEDTPPEKPQRHNFASEADYVDAMIQFGVDQRLAEKAEEDRQGRIKREREQILETAAGRINRAIELVPDFSDITGSIDTVVPPAVAGYMQKSEMFAELAYHLAKNQDLLVSLAKLPPDEQLVKIGKIESTLSPFEPSSAQNDNPSSKKASNGQAKPAPSAETDIDLSKPRGKAAPVITPLDAAGSAGASKDSRDMNIREAIEDFSKRQRVNLGIRKRH